MNERRFSKNGEWATRFGAEWRIGLSEETLDDLGEISFVELPLVGKWVKAGDSVGTVEAAKAATDYFSPLDGQVVRVNHEMETSSGKLFENRNHPPWIFALAGVQDDAFEALLSEEQWKRGNF